MYGFDYLNMMKKILLHNLERFEFDEYTNREFKELMLLNVVKGKISWKNMYWERLNYSRVISNKIKFMKYISNDN